VVFGAPTPAQGYKKRSIFGRVLVDEDPEDVDTSEVVLYDAGEVVDHDTD